jgi:hypothetical protein
MRNREVKRKKRRTKVSQRTTSLLISFLLDYKIA